MGQYIGDTALAAVGTAGPILNLLLVLFMGIATGAGILSAQYFGAHDRQLLSRTVGNTLLLTLASGLLMSLIGFLATPFLFVLAAYAFPLKVNMTRQQTGWMLRVPAIRLTSITPMCCS